MFLHPEGSSSAIEDHLRASRLNKPLKLLTTFAVEVLDLLADPPAYQILDSDSLRQKFDGNFVQRLSCGGFVSDS